MSTVAIQGSSISYVEALKEINNWIDLRESEVIAKSIFTTPHSYLINAGFEASKFDGEPAHAYFGVSISENTDNPGQLILEPSLLFIPASHDKSDFSEERYIYKAPYVRDQDLALKSEISSDEAVAMLNRWSNQSEEWVDYVIENSIGGLTLVSDVPWTDVTSNYTEEEGLRVRIGLHTEQVNPAENLGLLFFNGTTDNYVSLIADDITTPKPPFGMEPSSNYYLLESYFNL